MRIEEEANDLPVRYGDDEDEASEPLGRVVYCASRVFGRIELPGKAPWTRATMSWDGGFMASPRLTHVGQEFHPHATVGSLQTPDASLAVCVNHFGRVERLLVDENEEAEPGQPLFLYTERAPTRDE